MENNWKYGDLILLRSNQKPFKFLSARSLIEKKVYLIEIKNQELGITYYDNFQECIFEIVPVLIYEAIKNYKKALRDLQTLKLNILLKRVNKENMINKEKIEQYKSQSIKIGDIVHIRHWNSKCYIQFLTEKTLHVFQRESNLKNLMNIKLTDTLDSYATFKIMIDPYLSFKLDGEFVSYDDTFYFENVKLKSTISFKKSQQINLKHRLNNKLSGENHINFPTIMEQSLGFNIYDASHIIQDQQDNQFDIFSVIQANKITSIELEEKQIFYGDFVRIKYILKQSTKFPYLNCEYNVSGTENVPIIQQSDDEDSICSIFQIVPFDELSINKPVVFQGNEVINRVLLRHWLTGKFLNVPTQLNTEITLNPCLDEFIHENVIHQKIHENVIHQKIKQEDIKNKDTNSYQRQTQSKLRNKIVQNFKFKNNKSKTSDNNNSPDQSPDKSPGIQQDLQALILRSLQKSEKLKESFEKLIEKYLNENFLAIKPTETDQKLLMSLNSFSIAKDDYYEEIDEEDQPFLQVNEIEYQLSEIIPLKDNQVGWLGSKDCFERKNLNKTQSVFKLKSSQSNSFFFFELVKLQEINDVQTVISKMYPILFLCQNPHILQDSNKLDINCISYARGCLINMCQWLCNQTIDTKFEDILSYQPNIKKQRILKEIGLLEMVMKILYDLSEYQNNKTNSCFIFQWYELMKKIILTTENLPSEIALDILLKEILGMTEFSKEYILKGDVTQISSHLKFEQINNQGLNLLLSFCSYNNQNKEHDKLAFKMIVEDVFENNQNKLFGDFVYNKILKKLSINISGKQSKIIDNEMQDNEPFLFAYISSTLQLLSEISKWDAGHIMKYLIILCPFQTCIQTISNPNIHSNIQALFMDIFLNSYLTFDSRYTQYVEFPLNLIIRPNIEYEKSPQVQKQRHQFEQRYLSNNISQDASNLKLFCYNQLIELRKLNINSNDNHRILSLIYMFEIFLKKNFYTQFEIQNIHFVLDDFIKNSYTFLLYQKNLQQGWYIQQKNTQSQFDINSAFKWIVKTLECIYYIELYEQNSMLYKFFTLDQGQQQFSIKIKTHYVYELKQNWKLIQEKLIQEKKGHLVRQFMNCIEIPETEIIYYYLRILDFNQNEMTQVIVKLIFQIFSMRENILRGFNDIYFVNENNVQEYQTFSILYQQIFIQLVDLKSIKGEEKNNEAFRQQYKLIDTTLDQVADHIFMNYSNLKSQEAKIFVSIQNTEVLEKHNFIDKHMAIVTKFQSIKKHYKVPDNLLQNSRKKPKENEVQDNQIKISEKMIHQMSMMDMLKIEKHDERFYYAILKIFLFDVRKAQQIQDTFRHLKFHKLLMDLIKQISLPGQLEHNKQDTFFILETSSLLLIFFCFKNIKNQNIITQDPQFLDFIEDLHKFPSHESQLYILLLISELFKDNQYLLISLQKDLSVLIKNLQLKFIAQIESNKKIISNYCIYYVQLLHTFYKVKNANLIQNKVLIFNVINNEKMKFFCKNLIEQFTNFEVRQIQSGHIIEVPDNMILLYNFIYLMNSLLKAEYDKIIYEAKHFFPITSIIKILENMDGWYFIKAELFELVNIIYIQNKKKDEEEIENLRKIYESFVIIEINNYLANINSIKSNQYVFYSNFQNLFSIQTQYSTPQNIIDILEYDAVNYYMVYGIIASYIEYSEHFFQIDNKTINLNILYLYNKCLNKLLEQQFSDSANQSSLEQEQDTIQLLSPSNRSTQNLLSEGSTNFWFSRSRRHLRQKSNLETQTIADGKFIELEKIQEELRKLENIEKNIQSSTNYKYIINKYEKQIMESQKYDNIWESLQQSDTQIIEESFIENEHRLEMDILIGLLVKMRNVDIFNFKNVVFNFMNLLADSNTDQCIKGQTIKILRHLANFKTVESIGKEIQKDLCDLGYTKFLCQVISKQTIDFNTKFEYIIALVDFLDEGEEVQLSLMSYMEQDKENILINSIHQQIQISFSDFQEFEKGLTQKNLTNKLQTALRIVIKEKIECCIQAILILKLACEGHYLKMQNYIRQQIDSEGKLLSNNVNLLQFGVDIFGQYIKLKSQDNTQIGEKIMDFLIEIIQGPCYSNQQALCETKILEILQDLIYEVAEDSYYATTRQLRLKDILVSSLMKRIYIFLLSLFEGVSDEYVINKVQSFLQPQALLKRLIYIYNFRSNPKITLKSLYKQISKLTNNISNQEQTFLSHVLEKAESQSLYQMLNHDDDLNEYNMKQIQEQYDPLLDDLKQEGYNIYILLRSMSFTSQIFKKEMKKQKRKLQQKMGKEELDLLYRTNHYFKVNTAKVEILFKNEIQLILFPKPEICRYLSESTKENFLLTVQREQANLKINGLISKIKDFVDEMQHFQFMYTNFPIDLDNLYTQFRLFVLIISFIINFLLLFDEYTELCIECKGKYGQGEDSIPCVCPIDTPSYLQNAIFLFGVLLSLFNMLNILIWACLKMKIDTSRAFNSYDNIIKEKKKFDKFKLKSKLLLDIPIELIRATELMQQYMQDYIYKYIHVLQQMAFESYFLYLSLQLIWTTLGIYQNRVFYSFMLLDIIERSQILQNIIKAITSNINQLCMTVFLGLVIMYIYSMFSFYNPVLHKTMILSEDNKPICYNPVNCFCFVLNLGMRSGGGIGELIKQPHPDYVSQYVFRFFFDISFYLLIIIIWLNIIFGIIIDTFAELREIKNAQNYDQINVCFICNIEKTVFEKQGIFFEEHIENQHNIWNYVYYIVHLKQKEQIEYTGIESEIITKFEKGDISWFPIGKAQILQISDESDENQTFSLIQQIEQKLGDIIDDKNMSFLSSQNSKLK